MADTETTGDLLAPETDETVLEKDMDESNDDAALAAYESSLTDGDVEEVADLNADHKPEDEGEVVEPDTRSPTQKRIDQLTAKSKTAEEALALEKEKTKSLEEKIAVSSATGSLAIVDDTPLANSEADIATREAALATFIDTLETWRDDNGVDDEFEENGEFYSHEDVVAALKKSRVEMTTGIPLAKQKLKQRIESEQAAKRLYPSLFIENSPDQKEALGILQEVPELANNPNKILILGRMLSGKRREAKIGPASPNKKPPPPNAPPSGLAPRRSVSSSSTGYSMKAIQDSGFSEDAILEEMAKVL